MIDKNDYSVDWTKWVLTQLAGAKVDAFVLICKFFLRRIINISVCALRSIFG